VLEKNFKNGKLDGILKRYCDDGALMELSNFKLNFQHGTSTFYNNSGKEISKKEYHNGELVKIIL